MPATKKKKTPVKKVQARKPSRKWWQPHLVHPKHSFKVLPRHHTSYPLLVFMLLLVGLFSFSWTAFTSADITDTGNFHVYAVVPAAPLTSGAEITYPADGDTVGKQVIAVAGTCPDSSYITLYRNGIFAGSVLCQSDGTWNIQISLVVGSNTLLARDYNITNSPGPATSPVIVTYTPGAVTQPNPDGDGETDTSIGSTTNTNFKDPITSANLTATEKATLIAAASRSPFSVTGEYSYSGVRVNQPYSQPVTLAGGKAPYAVNIDWGDGTSDLTSRAAVGTFALKHIYKNPGKYLNSYIISIMGKDADGQTGIMQVVSIVNPEHIDQAGTVGDTGSSGDSGSSGFSAGLVSFWRVAGPVYGVSLLVVVSYWLGQRREFELLYRRAVRSHRQRPVR